jgi:hypothetical protein
MIKKLGLIGLGLLLVGGVLLFPRLQKLRVVVPEYQPTGELVLVDQGWSAAQRTAFHHTAQGTRLVPYRWLLALEQPCLSPFGCELLAKPEYLSRFGFLASPAVPELNPDGLPIGFARQEDFLDTDTGKKYAVAGLTCAACHTGELHYGKYAVRVEGGPAMIQVTAFQKALGISLILTELIPWRYRAFEERVLGPNASPEQRAELKAGLERFLTKAKAEVAEAEKRDVYPHDAGFVRTDALTRIGNQVFAVDTGNFNNLAVAKAPVRFPQIWDASWFTWVQYNSSISDPLVRNIGEALGVRAMAKLSGPQAKEFANSVHMPGLKKLEDLLSGAEPYTGLRSPKWPAVFPALDAAKVARGKELYAKHCQGCHLPPPEELALDLKADKPVFWVTNSLGKRFLDLRDIPLSVVGTDGNQALAFSARTAETGDLGQGRVSASVGLKVVTEGIRDQFFKKAGLSAEEQAAWRGYRDDSIPAVRDEAIYKARPLNGIWAVAPYLHNGSVPTLYELLASKEQRPARVFWTGSKRFDPVKVGYETTEMPGASRFDPAEPGNSNTGHWFQDGPRGNGVVGAALTEADRWSLIEYLKSL